MLELAPGTTLGAYVIVARIGRGGMATVYQAHHPALDRNVAIKVLWQTLAETPGFLERFRREARAASRLRHPNILTVYDFGEMDGIAYMVTELLPGGTLADRLGRPQPYTESLRILRGIGAALDAAHVSGLIHRDVKPSNILFTRDGEPVLADFGIARLAEAEEQLTVRGTMIGTPHYMAPEMATGEAIGPYSDLYSLGVVLYEMLVGEPPFPRDTPLATVRAHIHDTPTAVSRRVRGTPPGIDRFFERALAKDPEQRYRSGAALVGAFEEALLEEDSPTPRPGSVLPVRPQHPPAITANVPAAAAPEWTPPPYPQAGSPPPYRPHSPDDFGAVIPGPPIRHQGVPESDTDLWRRAAVQPRRRRISPLGLALVVLVALLATAGAYFARASGADLPFLGRAGQAATRTPTVGALVTVTPTRSNPLIGASPGAEGSPTTGTPAIAGSAVAGSSPSPSPMAAVSPTADETPTPTPAPALTPTSTETPASPTLTPDPRRGPLAVAFISPTDGEAVPARPPVVGRRTGLQDPDEHLWMLIHPVGGPDNWWPYKGELIAGRDGTWQLDDVEIGGPPGSQHVLAVGVVDAATHDMLQQQIRDRQDEPFVGGQPPGFQELTRVTVTKK
ncbi:MAG: protein kinase [Chloroflexota bacterium]